MAIPDFQSVMLPLLQFVSDGKERRMREVISGLADRMGISQEERSQMMPSGQQAYWANRIGWATTHMKHAELVESPSRGVLRISALGKQALGQNPSKINMAFLRQYPSYLEF